MRQQLHGEVADHAALKQNVVAALVAVGADVVKSSGLHGAR